VSATTYAWLVLALPLAGCLVTAFGWRSLPGRAAGWIGTAAIALAFLNSIAALVMLLDKPASGRELTSSSASWSTRCRCS
jgi:NADH:ubiquinone oxidoreductase subunit 5 (subunit L)/multisubunit Na+/H+ antiporter MnhA subunit